MNGYEILFERMRKSGDFYTYQELIEEYLRYIETGQLIYLSDFISF